MMDGQGSQSSSTTKNVVVGCLIAAGVALVLIGVGCLFGWRALIDFGVNDDLGEIVVMVEQAEVEEADEAQKASLVERLEALRSRARRGDRPAFLVWIEFADAFKRPLDDNKLTESELNRMQTDLDDLEARQ
jgi:hypothetical protein